MKYFLGLDIGTNSVGIAATDENYNLLRAKGKDLWSVRLFDEGKVAEDRRLKRCARRRLERRKNRIKLLDELLAGEMSKTDENFYLRLKQSIFLNEDKDKKIQNDKYTLFNDIGFTDKEYYKKYPTIYHLRKAIIEKKKNEKLDIRLYYIVLHHIIKYRGHFLSDSPVKEIENTYNTDSNNDIIKDFKKLKEIFNECFERDVFDSTDEDIRNAIDILCSTNTTTDKKKQLKDILCKNNIDVEKLLCDLLAGGKVDLKKLDDKFEDFTDLKLCFKTDNEDKITEVLSLLDDYSSILVIAKSIYDKIYIKKLIGDNPSLSFAMVKLYEQHKKELGELKQLVKQNCPELFKRIFSEKDVPENYANYIGYVGFYGKDKKEKTGKSGKRKCNNEDFIKFLKHELSEKNSNDEIKTFLEKLENSDNYMPKVVNADGGKFPHQLHEQELKCIVQKLAEDYPETTKPFRFKGESDNIEKKSICDRLLKLFIFRIPYYVGPLGAKFLLDKQGIVQYESKNNWFVPTDGTENDKSRITPWNFEKRVDLKQSGEAFIRRMTNKCQYLIAEETLAKNSIIFQKYLVLNFINKIKIKGVEISVQDKQELYDEVYLTKKKPTFNDIFNFFKKKYTEIKNDDIAPNNSADYVVSMSSYNLFSTKFFDNHFDIYSGSKELEVAEKIINIMTLFTDKKDSLSVIKTKIPEITEAQLSVLKGWDFKDFGSFSRKLLFDLPIAKDERIDRELTFIDLLWQTNENFMQILHSDHYDARLAIEAENERVFSGKESDKELIEKMNLSPSVKRSVNQTLKMVDEYIKTIGEKPEKIFVEVTRKEEEKKRTKSRKGQIEDYYNAKSNKGKVDKDAKAEFDRIAGEIKALKDELNRKSDDELKSERLFLYFMQCGKCAYTGTRINLDDLSSNTYDVDHIIPQSLIKDDSLENKVLVLRSSNDKKTNIYPFYNRSDVVTESGKIHLSNLLKLKLISKDKYEKITRIKSLSETELRGFISRQIVETSWANKAVCEILKKKYYSDEKTENGYNKQKIVYSKANLVSQFRDVCKIYKCREVNDLHHAQDAYLNIVVGDISNGLLANYEKSKLEWNGGDFSIVDNKGELKRFNLERLFDRKTSKWDFEKDKNRIQKIATKPSPVVTRRSYIATGAFYDETVYRHIDTGITYPRKAKGPLCEKEKYGGYKSANTAYFCIFKAKDKKGKDVKYVEAVPVILSNKISNPEKVSEVLREYIQKKCDEKKLNSPEILIPCLKNKSLLNINGSLLYLTGCNEKQLQFDIGNQVFLDNTKVKFIKDIFKFVKKINKKQVFYSKKIELLKDKKQLSADEQETLNELQAGLDELNEMLKKDEFILHSNRFNANKTIKRDDLKNLYDLIISKEDKKIYNGLSFFGNVLSPLKENRDKIYAMNLYDMASLVLNVIQYLSGSNPYCDLRLIGKAEKAGNKILSKDITDLSKFEIIKQSNAGLYQKTIDVLAL